MLTFQDVCASCAHNYWNFQFVLAALKNVQISGCDAPEQSRTALNTSRTLSSFGSTLVFIGAKEATQTFFVRSFFTTLRVMDVRAENRGRPHQTVRFPAAPVVGRNFLTPGHSGVRVRSVRGKSDQKVYVYAVFLP